MSNTENKGNNNSKQAKDCWLKKIFKSYISYFIAILLVIIVFMSIKLSNKFDHHRILEKELSEKCKVIVDIANNDSLFTSIMKLNYDSIKKGNASNEIIDIKREALYLQEKLKLVENNIYIVEKRNTENFESYRDSVSSGIAILAAIVAVMSIAIPIIINNRNQKEVDRKINEFQTKIDGSQTEVDKKISESDQRIDEFKKEMNIELNTIKDNVKESKIYNIFSQAYYAKDSDTKIELYTELIELDGNKYPGAYNNRGLAYAKKKEFDNAIKDYNRAIELKPDFAEAYYNKGIVYADKKEFENAIKNYTKAIELKENYANAYNNRGIVYADKKEFDNAIKDYSRAIELNPNYAEAYSNRGHAYAKTNDFDKAIMDYNRAIELKPDFAEAYNNRGLAYANKGDLDKTITDLDKAIELKPNYAEAYYNRGLAYVDKNDLDNAINVFTKSIELNPDYAEAYWNRGLAYNSMADKYPENAEEYNAKAKEDFDKARELGFKSKDEQDVS